MIRLALLDDHPAVLSGLHRLLAGAKGMEVLAAAAEAKATKEGLAEGKAQLLLKQLRLRGFSVSRADRQRILACTDHAVLDAWAARVLTAADLPEVLGGLP